ncbi:hypothetical protein D3C78_996350 [compost metagenome]
MSDSKKMTVELDWDRVRDLLDWARADARANEGIGADSLRDFLAGQVAEGFYRQLQEMLPEDFRDNAYKFDHLQADHLEHLTNVRHHLEREGKL